MINKITALILIFLLCLVVVLPAQERPYGSRILSSHSHSGNSMFAWDSETNGTYHYNSDNTAFFDSITYISSSSSYWYWGNYLNYTYKYRHNIYYQDGNEYAEHHEYSPNHDRINIYSVVRNPVNQIIKYGKSIVNNDGTPYSNWFRLLSYNSFGKPDSVYHEFTANNISNRVCYLFQYDNLHRISQVLQYTYQNAAWSVINRKVHHYANDVIPYPASLRFIDYCYYAITHDLHSLLYICDTDYPPQSIENESWNGSKWIPAPQMYYVYINNSSGLVSISISYDYSYGLTYRFSLATGLYRGNSSGGGESWDSSSITWEDYVTNQDDYLPETISTIFLSVYPNPFKNNLTIKTKDNSIEDISIYNIKGQLVRTWKDVKSDELIWDGKDATNQSVSSGVYIIKAKQGNKISTAKVLKY